MKSLLKLLAYSLPLIACWAVIALFAFGISYNVLGIPQVHNAAGLSFVLVFLIIVCALATVMLWDDEAAWKEENSD